jgi:hypothetical protein
VREIRRRWLVEASGYTLIVGADIPGRKACSELRAVKLFDTYKLFNSNDIGRVLTNSCRAALLALPFFSKGRTTPYSGV